MLKSLIVTMLFLYELELLTNFDILYRKKAYIHFQNQFL